MVPVWGSPRTQRALYSTSRARAVQQLWVPLFGSYPRGVVVVLLLVVHEASCGASLVVRLQAKVSALLSHA